jgi:hypothetical protein
MVRVAETGRDLLAPRYVSCPGISDFSIQLNCWPKTVGALRDAAQYIKLPVAERDTEWQTALQALILVAEHNGPPMFARIGVMRALNRRVERAFNPDRKDHHWGKRKLARDR